ncbi:ribosomal large subunit pseudouridine synthase D [Cyanobium sp. PCC 7001]|uniref:pseudouridine synthase n=1 Tax=Cyanobium sp. PCC 7001 TaxID=180281 RepID=UPI0001805C28|nr:pseudouridine synthase [Cyanobium sp. PCC 7001]EDY38241.1 ribosomal large subunit pseudouridine synthase D [Cyanobium sp. PCC 7001]
MSPHAARNGGHAYRDTVRRGHPQVSRFYAGRYPHSPASVWLERIAAGEIVRNGQQLRADGELQPGDQLVWHRPPWLEPAVPDLPGPLFDDGDLLVLAKPAGLPVLPAGGYLEHTVLRLLERQVRAGRLDGRFGLPRPVHRLGRFTSGLLVCARRRASRAWLSALLRDGTAEASRAVPLELQEMVGEAPAACRKLYRALAGPLPVSGPGALELGETLRITTPIGRRPHQRLGEVWSAGGRNALPALTTITLLERRGHGCLVEAAIGTGRPHQIRIHLAAVGAPLLGDPLYRPGGGVNPGALPGDPGYRLHAHRLTLPWPPGQRLALEVEAPPPPELAPALTRHGGGMGMSA